MEQNTAVDWFAEMVTDMIHESHHSELADLFEAAKEMEKQQKKRVYNEGYRDAEREWGGHGDKDISEYNNAEQYSLPGVNDAKVIKSSPNFIKENSQHSSIKKNKT